jgi:hypothetical protein
VRIARLVMTVELSLRNKKYMRVLVSPAQGRAYSCLVCLSSHPVGRAVSRGVV